MDWAAAMYGVNYGFLDALDGDEFPSKTQRAMRRTVSQLYSDHYRLRHNEDSQKCPMSLLQSSSLLVEYKRED